MTHFSANRKALKAAATILAALPIALLGTPATAGGGKAVQVANCSMVAHGTRYVEVTASGTWSGISKSSVKNVQFSFSDTTQGDGGAKSFPYSATPADAKWYMTGRSTGALTLSSEGFVSYNYDIYSGDSITIQFMVSYGHSYTQATATCSVTAG